MINRTHGNSEMSQIFKKVTNFEKCHEYSKTSQKLKKVTKKVFLTQEHSGTLRIFENVTKQGYKTNSRKQEILKILRNVQECHEY